MTDSETSASSSPSTTATISLAIGCAGFALVVVGILGIHLGLWSPLLGFRLYSLGALPGGLLALGVALVAFFLTRGDETGRLRAILGFVLGVVLLATVVVGVVPALGKPAINDISTDLEDPPVFTAAAELPANRGRDMGYPEGFGEIVERAYPGLRTLEMDGPPEQSYRRALDAAEELGWEVTFRDPDALVFEATDSSALFRFVDDVRVRVRETGSSGSEVDMRSKSRVGRGDLGANAARIRAFADEMRRSAQRDLTR